MEGLREYAHEMRARWRLALRELRSDFSNFHILHYRKVDGFLITAKNSGTHWLKFMLSHALAHELNLPPPLYASGPNSDDFIGHPRCAPKYPELPWIGSSHNLPSRMLGWGAVRRAFDLPQVVVLVRDIREAMLSHHVKWGDKFGLSLSEYLKLPPQARKDHLADLWWFLDFFNRWGGMAYAFPHEVLIVRYEDLLAEPGYWLQRIFDHYRLTISSASIEAALKVADRESIQRRLDPEHREAIVPDATVRRAAGFDTDDEAYFRRQVARYLKFGFGYGLADEGKPVVIQQRPSRSYCATAAAASEVSI